MDGYPDTHPSILTSPARAHWQARTGLVIAQFEALPEKARADALARAKERRDKSPKGNMERVRERQQARHDKEKEQLAALDSGTADR